MHTFFDRRALAAAFLSCLLVFAVFIGAFGWLNLRVGKILASEAEDSLTRELATFSSVDSEFGRDALIASLRSRAEHIRRGRILMMRDPMGHYTIFNEQADPAAARDVLSSIEHRATSLPINSARVTLADGSLIAIGQADLRQAQFGQSLLAAGFTAMIVVLAAVLLVALRFNRYVVDRIEGIARAAREIMRGQMSVRAPGGQRLDAFGALSRTLNEMLDQNAGLVTGMRTVTDSLAHDLRMPLMRVQRAIAAARTAPDATQREAMLRDAEAEAERALRTFTSLIDLARAEAGLSRDAMESTDLAALLTDVVELFEPLAHEKGQRIHLQIAPVRVVAHRQLLFQAVANLLENAIKYSPAGTELAVALEPAVGGRGPALLVDDRGPGIPHNAREQALRPFVRLENATGTAGSGLGLAIASAAAKLHAGRLVLEDANPGLRVRLLLGASVRLPAALTDPSPAAAVAAMASPTPAPPALRPAVAAAATAAVAATTSMSAPQLEPAEA